MISGLTPSETSKASLPMSRKNKKISNKITQLPTTTTHHHSVKTLKRLSLYSQRTPAHRAHVRVATGGKWSEAMTRDEGAPEAPLPPEDGAEGGSHREAGEGAGRVNRTYSCVLTDLLGGKRGEWEITIGINTTYLLLHL